MASLVPDLKQAIPGAGRNGHAILRHSQTAHTIIVASENAYFEELKEDKFDSYRNETIKLVLPIKRTCSFDLQNVEDVGVKVVISGKEKSSAFRERYTCDTASQAWMTVGRNTLIGSNVE